eukprot:GCRY01002166.1.p1 GENE.GCRY01002166.1~~GCRY01002166.1.p1  ORF type:complete len:365 (+),score=51.51 GCRY01002166.1:215-1309(+)
MNSSWVNKPSKEGQKILYANFNQDFNCFSVGLENGFQIYNTKPLKQRTSSDLKGGIGIIEMLFRCNYLAIVGGGTNPKWPPTRLVIWDDKQKQELIHLDFHNIIKAVRLRRDKIIVVLERKVYVYTFCEKPENQVVFDTCENTHGIVALSSYSTRSLLAIPAPRKGHVLLADLDQQGPPSFIPAHNNPLQQLAFNFDGTRLATASEKGTLIRIFNPATKEQLQELRRGSNTALIHSIAFHYSSEYLCVTSDSKTIHVFSLIKPRQHSLEPTPFGTIQNDPPPNSKHPLSIFRGVSKYFGSEYSICQFHIEEDFSIAGFASINDEGNEQSLVVLANTGKYYTFTFDPSKKENNTFLKNKGTFGTS